MDAEPRQRRRIDVVWPVGEAKARLSELLEATVTDGPQTIVKRGKPVAVVVSVDEWDRKTRRNGTLAQFFQSIRPDDDDGLAIPDVDWSPRSAELD